MTKYRVILYHDELEEAAADSTGLGIFDSEDKAIVAARDSFSAGYWNSATVDRGEWDPGEPGMRPPLFTDADTHPSLYVGPDWIDR